MMVNAEKWPAQRECHGLTGSQADHKRAGKTGALRRTHGVKLIGSNASLAQCGLGDGSQIFNVTASG
jgi:hypothetical protein